MRVVSAGGVIAISILLIALGMSPTIVAFLDEHLPRAAAWWPAIGAGWAVAARVYKMPWAKDTAPANPTRMSEVLLREAELIEGRQPSPEEQRHIDDFQQQSDMRTRETQDDAPLDRPLVPWR
jgi:hypothetical protein